MTKNYKENLKKYHKKKEDIGNPNGTFIATYFQDKDKNKDGKDVILINIEKLENKKWEEFFIESVIVHEITHCLIDKKIYPELKEKYGLYSEDKSNFKQKNIGQLYQNYSEMHAKYTQEEYIINTIVRCNNHPLHRSINIRKYINGVKEHNELKDENDYYISRSVGYIKCWEDSVKCEMESLKIIVKEIKNEYLNTDEKRSFFDIFEYENFRKKCIDLWYQMQ